MDDLISSAMKAFGRFDRGSASLTFPFHMIFDSAWIKLSNDGRHFHVSGIVKY